MEPKFILSDVFKAAWKGTRSQLWILAGLLIGYGILFFTLVAFAMPMQSSMAGMIVVNVISVLFSCLFSLGYMKNIFQALDGEEPQFSASVLVGAIVLIGCTLFILPGIYLALRLQFFWAAIVEERAGAIESIRRSWEITRGQLPSLLLLAITLFGIVLLGCILFGIGLFVAVPLVYMMYGYAFRKLTINN